MTVLSFISMFIFMYVMVNVFANVYPNLNQFYMAGLMTAPMVLIELGVMRGMYTNNRANIAVAAVSVIALAAFFIMMCEKAPLADAEIKKLCGAILESQRKEISEMKAILARLDM